MPGSGEKTGPGKEDIWCIIEDKDLASAIIEDMRLLQEVMGEYDFKTEKLHIDLVAAANNLHRVNDDVINQEDYELPRLHRVVPDKMEYDKVAPYLLYRPKEVVRRTLGNTTQLDKAVS